MAGLNNFGKYGLNQTVDFKSLFKSSEKVNRDHSRVTIQDMLRELKSTEEPTQQKSNVIKNSYKGVPMVKGDEGEKKDQKQSVRKEQELAKKQETERIEKSSAYDKEKNTPQDTRAGYLPLREAVILSEIIGAPRCKSRYGRRR